MTAYVVELSSNPQRSHSEGKDLQKRVLAPHSERLGHVRDDVRLGDRLPVADRQRRVVVSAGRQLPGHELLAWNGAHRLEHSDVVHAAAFDLSLGHLAALPRSVSRLGSGDAAEGE